MKKLILLSYLLLATIHTIAQEDERDLHRMKQIAGTEHKIIDFF